MDSSRPTEAVPTRSEQIERVAAEWLARRDGGASGDGDDAALEAWLAQDVAHRVAYLRLQAAWEHTGRLDALGAGLRGAGVPPRGFWGSHAGDEVRPRPDPAAALDGFAFAARRPRGGSRGRFAAVAALAACALAVGWGWHAFAPVEAVSHATTLGVVRTVPLADGSSTTLASDSRIDVRLSRRERRIDLHRGEAYFEAAKDPGRPFVVDAGERRVVAVGTRFSVRRDGPDLRVVVTEGMVRLESDPVAGQARPPTLLPAGSVAIARRDGVLVRSMPLAEAARLVDWRSGLLLFRDTPLAEAADEFNRYNARKIVIGDPAVGDLRIGGSFRWENAEGFVRLLEQGFPVRAEYRSDRIVLHSP
ncbi:DUF4880 domain-containing protein [Luteimonas viscosa]|uniref:DUF4880 domain-containing protein n=1 Tax=Luteimonas viscosa TaxID=1132694 RepID=A0A5D4XUC1_9GAMM|nr:DUF4880 domain-containing protein [Luteimonas viscosa]